MDFLEDLYKSEKNRGFRLCFYRINCIKARIIICTDSRFSSGIEEKKEATPSSLSPFPVSR